jgi:hypothetical protein
MKVLKRIGLLLLAALMLVVFVACGNQTSGSGRGQARRTDWPGPKPEDLGGLVFKIADFHDDRFLATAEQLGTPVGDMKAVVMKSIEDDFNIKFELINVPPAEMVNRLLPAVWAGDMFAHLIVGTQWAFGSLIGAGLLGDLSAIPTLDLNNGMWNKSVHRATGIGGEVLATAGIYEFWGLTWVTYFNKGLWNELNLPDPYELVRRGEWTWDKLLEFSNIAKSDLNGDGVIDSPNDRWGFVAPGDDL